MTNWIWGLSLTILTIILHATGAAFIVLLLEHIWARLEEREDRRRYWFWHWIVMNASTGLFLAALHGLEIVLWAAAYWRIGALGSLADALYYSIDSMTTRGASGLALRRDWRLLGALEGINGMLLFGLSTALMFAIMHTYWEKLLGRSGPP